MIKIMPDGVRECSQNSTPHDRRDYGVRVGRVCAEISRVLERFILGTVDSSCGTADHKKQHKLEHCATSKPKVFSLSAKLGDSVCSQIYKPHWITATAPSRVIIMKVTITAVKKKGGRRRNHNHGRNARKRKARQAHQLRVVRDYRSSGRHVEGRYAM